MTDGAAEFRPTRVGAEARRPVVIAPLLLVAVIGIAVLGGRAPAGAAAQVDAPLPAVRAPTWSVPQPNEVRTKGVRLMRLARLVDPYER